MMSQPSSVRRGGGLSPILLASHHPPERADRRICWSPQCCRSGEKDIHLCAPMFGMAGGGAGIMAYRPPKRAGKSAASLSSGGRSEPHRVKSRKSRVVARETSGPQAEKAV